MIMKKEQIIKNNSIAVYQAKNGAIELRADSKMETVWATQAQIAEIFDIERSVITKHINNIIKIHFRNFKFSKNLTVLPIIS